MARGAILFPRPGLADEMLARAAGYDPEAYELKACCASRARAAGPEPEAVTVGRLAGSQHGNGHTRVVTVAGTPAAAMFVTLVNAPAADPAAVDGVARRVGEAVRDLPHAYREWVSAAVGHVAVDAADVGTRNSSSNAAHLFSVTIALNAGRQAIGEMLVHEASHQVYNLTVACETICRPGAPQVHSALKGTLRPLERVVFALHATANIVRFYASDRSDETASGDSWARDSAIADHGALSDACRGALAWLTDDGRAIVEALTRPQHPSDDTVPT